MIHRNNPTPNRPLPYNTGKVEIGRHYVPPSLFYSSQDADLIQTALLTKNTPTLGQRFWHRFLGWFGL